MKQFLFWARNYLTLKLIFWSQKIFDQFWINRFSKSKGSHPKQNCWKWGKSDKDDICSFKFEKNWKFFLTWIVFVKNVEPNSETEKFVWPKSLFWNKQFVGTKFFWEKSPFCTKYSLGPKCFRVNNYLNQEKWVYKCLYKCLVFIWHWCMGPQGVVDIQIENLFLM